MSILLGRPRLINAADSDAGVEVIQLVGYQRTAMVAVQHDLLRAAWLKNRGRGAEAWHALSNSIR